MSRYCEYCDGKVLPDDRNCHHCGAPITRTKISSRANIILTKPSDCRFRKGETKTITIQYDEV